MNNYEIDTVIISNSQSLTSNRLSGYKPCFSNSIEMLISLELQYYDYSNSSYTSLMTRNSRIEQFLSDINCVFQDIKNEIIEIDNNDTDSKNHSNTIVQNYHLSLNNCAKFIECINSDHVLIFKPEISIDQDGEISLEWYGRIGARANITFGRNGELFFISLYHGELLKSKFFFSEDSIKRIEEELDKLYKDKIA